MTEERVNIAMGQGHNVYCYPSLMNVHSFWSLDTGTEKNSSIISMAA